MVLLIERIAAGDGLDPIILSCPVPFWESPSSGESVTIWTPVTAVIIIRSSAVPAALKHVDRLPMPAVPTS